MVAAIVTGVILATKDDGGDGTPEKSTTPGNQIPGLPSGLPSDLLPGGGLPTDLLPSGIPSDLIGGLGG
ncbi:hypothetical protein ACU686_22990 [Yinghuangia aomiensis]